MFGAVDWCGARSARSTVAALPRRAHDAPRRRTRRDCPMHCRPAAAVMILARRPHATDGGVTARTPPPATTRTTRASWARGADDLWSHRRARERATTSIPHVRRSRDVRKATYLLLSRRAPASAGWPTSSGARRGGGGARAGVCPPGRPHCPPQPRAPPRTVAHAPARRRSNPRSCGALPRTSHGQAHGRDRRDRGMHVREAGAHSASRGRAPRRARLPASARLAALPCRFAPALTVPTWRTASGHARASSWARRSRHAV